MRCIREPVGVKCRKSPTATPVSAGAVRILNKQIRNAHKHGSVILSGVEESSHSRDLCTQIGGKILRLLPKICDFLQSLRMTERYILRSDSSASQSR